MSSDRLYTIVGGLLFNPNALNIYLSRSDYPRDILAKSKLILNILDFIKEVHNKENVCISYNRFLELISRKHNIPTEEVEDDERVGKYFVVYEKCKEKYYDDSKSEEYLEKWRAELKWAIYEYIRKKRMEISKKEHLMMKTSCFSYFLAQEKCKSCDLLRDCKMAKSNEKESFDFVSMWREDQEEKLRSLLLDEQKIRTCTYSDNVDERIQRYEETYKFRREGGANVTKGIPFSLPTLNQWSDGWCKGKAYGIAGRTGQGKSALALQESLYAWSNSPSNILYFNLEIVITEIEERLDAARTGVAFEKIAKGSWSDEKEFKDFKKLIEKDKENRTNQFVVLDVPKLSMGQMRYYIRQYHRKWGSNFIVVLDNLNRMDYPHHKPEIGANMIVKEFHSCVKEFNIAGLFVCQLNRDAEGAIKVQAKHFRDCDKIPDHLDACFAIVPRGNSMNKTLVVVKGRSFAGNYIMLQNRLDIMRLIEIPKNGNSDEIPVDEDEDKFL